MKNNVVNFPKKTQPCRKEDSSLFSGRSLFLDNSNKLLDSSNKVIEVDFGKVDEERALQRLRNAFDEARADWVLEEAEFPELNKRTFTF